MTPMLYVNVYIGQTRAAGWIRTLEGYGFGECVSRGELPNRRNPWFYDNGAFKDWDRATPMRPESFNAAKYEKDLNWLWLHGTVRPDFMVVPDLPMGGLESLAFSETWRPKLEGHKRPLYLVVQDGMETWDLDGVLEKYAGVFVGGSLPWKLKTAKEWTDFAHRNGKKCHVGRMGTEDRVRAALRWGVDSIDSCLPLWSEDNLRRFLKGFNPSLTAELFPEAA